MAEDKQNVTQSMLRAWHEKTFPGYSDSQRAALLLGKLDEETDEFFQALDDSLNNGDGSLNTPEIQQEAADMLIVLMTFAEFAGFNLTAATIAKFNENTNRVWVLKGNDPATGMPVWERERDSRPDGVK